MDPTTTASATTLLTMLLTAFGLGKYTAEVTAGIGSLAVLVVFLAGQIMPYLPVAEASSSTAYRIFYGIMARITGSRANNAPMPPSGQPAGGLVPTPPALKTGDSVIVPVSPAAASVAAAPFVPTPPTTKI